MKKLKLNLQGKEVLSKSQMRQISGGYFDCECPDGDGTTDIGAPGECENNPIDCKDLCDEYCASH